MTTTPKPSISVLINTRNEASNLPDCLKSVAWADEVVVADQSSTDKTREIALAAGARVAGMPHTPPGMVEPIRNLAIEQCKCDWVLIVDADERVPVKMAESLRRLAASPDAEAYGLPRRNYFLGCWLEHGFWPDHQIRFFRKGAVSWSGIVHEPPAIKGRLRELPALADEALEHPGYGNDLSLFIQKLVTYSAIQARDLENSLRPPVWPYLFRRPLGEFYSRYIIAGAWRHGMHGLVWSLIMGNYQLLIAIHYWALSKSSADLPPDELRRQVRWEAIRSTARWLRRAK